MYIINYVLQLMQLKKLMHNRNMHSNAIIMQTYLFRCLIQVIRYLIQVKVYFIRNYNKYSIHYYQNYY